MCERFLQDIDLTETIFGSVEGGRRHHRGGGTRILPTDKPFLQYKYIIEQTIFDTKIGFFLPLTLFPNTSAFNGKMTKIMTSWCSIWLLQEKGLDETVQDSSCFSLIGYENSWIGLK